ncbi:sulfotransferase [Desulfatiferula olefinivorans]
MKIFCISMQRSGTTSVGKFLRDSGYRWAGWLADLENGWSAAWYNGDYEKIFTSQAFIDAEGFEDSPWWMPGFYKILYHRFDHAKFILFSRDPDDWFRSMCVKFGGYVPGGCRIHSKIYHREKEFYTLRDQGVITPEDEDKFQGEKKMRLDGLADHYKWYYELHNREVRDFFRRHDPSALFDGDLYDPDKWRKLGRFLGVHVPAGYECHENRSRPLVSLTSWAAP